MSIRGKLAMLLLLVTLTTLPVAMGIALWHSSDQVRTMTIRTAEERVEASAAMLSGFFSARLADVTAYANSPRMRRMDWQGIRPWLRAEVQRLGGAYEKIIVGLPDGHFHNTAVGNPAQGGLASFDDSDPAAKLKSIAERPYWRYLVGENPRAEARWHVSNPMISYSTGVRQVVVGATVLSDEGRVKGMVGGAVPWKEIESRIDGIRDEINNDFGAAVRVALVDSAGIYVYHWDPERVVHLELDAAGQPVINDIGEKSVVLHRITEEAAPELAQAGARMDKGETGHVFYTDAETGERLAVVFAPVPSADYAIAMILPERVIMAPVARLRLMFLWVLIAAVVVCTLAAVLLSGRLSRRVVALNEAAQQIAEGNLDTRVDASGKDEISQLAAAFNQMGRDLEKYVTQLADEQAARARIERDLEVAHEIQRGLLPKEELDIAGFEVVGWNQPADETGGDYYDWQHLPDGRWAVSVADVTGHGIGPALVTTFCRAYSRASLPSPETLERSVDRINDLIHEDMQEGRFVTFALAILDPATGSVEILSAGHGPLLVYRARDRHVDVFGAHGIPLGLMADVGYGPAQQHQFETGDMLVLVTDGFFEWANAEDEQYGINRLVDTVKAYANDPVQDLISGLHQRVEAFVGDVPQSDDLTVVVVKRTAP